MSSHRTFDARVLSAHENYLMTLHECPGNSDNRLLITFGPANSDLSDKGFGTSLAIKLGIDTLYVAQRPGTYYQGLSLERFLTAVTPIISGRDVIAYGGSLGAWCALYYGGPIDARILAFSPLNPGHPDFLMKGFPAPVLDYAHLDLRASQRSSRRVIVALDPYREFDVSFSDRFVFPGYPSASRFDVPFAGHNILDRMRRAGTLKRFVTDVLDGKLPDDLPIREEGCPFWHFERARMFRKKNDKIAAEAEYRAALEAEFSRVTVTNLVSFVMQMKTDDQLCKTIAEIGPARVLAMLPARIAEPLIKSGHLQSA